MPIALAPRKALAVWFQDLDRWDVSYFRRIHWAWPKIFLKPIGEALIRKVREVNTKENKMDLPIIKKISFSGEVSIVNDPGSRSKYKGRLFWANAGELVYSKIRVKQGSLAVVPTSISRLAVSAEYPVYTTNQHIALGPYLVLVLKSQAFQSYLEGLAHGGSTKTRIHPTVFEKLIIPLPSLAVQEGIVAHWRAAQEAILKSREAIANMESEIQLRIFEVLGMRSPIGERPVPKIFGLWWKELERWSVEYLARMLAGSNSPDKGKYPMLPLNQITEGRSGGTPSTKRKDYWGGKVPWVSPKDMKGLEIYHTQDHLHETVIEEAAVTLIPKDSMLVVVRSGILQRCVPVAIARIPVAINQDIRAFTVKNEKLLPEFLLHYLNARQDLLLRLVKYSTTVQSINKEELEALFIPVPPLEVQREIVDIVNRQGQRIAAERKTAEERQVQASREVEEMILGVRPVK